MTPQAPRKTISGILSEAVAAILRADPVLREAGVAVLERRRGDWAAEAERAMAESGGIVALVCFDSAEAGRPLATARHSVEVAETVPVNRLREGHVTALDAAWRIVDLLDGEIHHWRGLRHDAPDEAHLVATAEFETLFERAKPAQPGKGE